MYSVLRVTKKNPKGKVLAVSMSKSLSKDIANHYNTTREKTEMILVRKECT